MNVVVHQQMIRVVGMSALNSVVIVVVVVLQQLSLEECQQTATDDVIPEEAESEQCCPQGFLVVPTISQKQSFASSLMR
jgi:hypothetical protein